MQDVTANCVIASIDRSQCWSYYLINVIPVAAVATCVPAVCNCLFRSNGSAVLLSSKASDARRSKYWVRDVVRTNLASDDVAYNCVMQTEDAERVVGVRLNKDLVKVGAKALRMNMTKLVSSMFVPPVLSLRTA